MIKSRAAVAWEANKPLTIETIDISGPKPGEVLIEIMATGVCHTDAYTLSGLDSEGKFPAILGHEGAGIVREVGAGVTSVKPGDHVIPLYTPECRGCKTCLSQRSNLCTAIRSTQGQGLMPDRTTRFSCEPVGRGKNEIFHYMGCSTFSNFTVLPEIAVAKVREDAPFDKICYIGCGVTTGIGAVIYTAKVRPGSNVVVFGLGGIGLNVIQGARMVGADKIIGVDLNPAKAEMAKKFGMTHFVNPDEVGPREGGRGDRRPHRRRRRLFVRMHRQHHDHATGARVLPSRLGRKHHHRRGAVGHRDLDSPVPARHRPRLEGLGLRRRTRAHRRAEDRRLVHGGQDRHRQSDHPHHAARRDQHRLRSDARGQVDPQRGGLLTPAGGSASVLHASAERGDAGGVGVRAMTRTREHAPMLYGLWHEWMKTARFTVETQQVIALRLMRIAPGGAWASFDRNRHLLSVTI